jgi:hypothetical protein
MNVPVLSQEVTKAPKKHTWLPLLTVLFLLSYGLMTMLIIEQGQTIESQRVLIKELFRDSTELSAVKNKSVNDKNALDARHRAQTQAQTPSSQMQANKVPAAQTPSTQSQSAPSSQIAQQHRSQTQGGKIQKPQFQVPSRPAADLADDRRTLKSI